MNRAIQAIRAGRLSGAKAQTSGIRREAAIAPETTGNRDLWMGLATSPAGAVSGWHHHGDCETGLYVLQGRARLRWGKGGAESLEVGPGDFLGSLPLGKGRQRECRGGPGRFSFCWVWRCS